MTVTPENLIELPDLWDKVQNSLPNPVLEVMLDAPGVYLAGGYLVNITRELDLTDDVDVDLFVSKPIIVNEIHDEWKNDKRVTFLKSSGWAYSYDYKGRKIQLILKSYPTMVDLFNNFDFKQSAIAIHSDRLVAAALEGYDDIEVDFINWDKIKENPNRLFYTAVRRIAKYERKGFACKKAYGKVFGELFRTFAKKIEVDLPMYQIEDSDLNVVISNFFDELYKGGEIYPEKEETKKEVPSISDDALDDIDKYLPHYNQPKFTRNPVKWTFPKWPPPKAKT